MPKSSAAARDPGTMTQGIHRSSGFSDFSPVGDAGVLATLFAIWSLGKLKWGGAWGRQMREKRSSLGSKKDNFMLGVGKGGSGSTGICPEYMQRNILFPHLSFLL